MNIFKSHIPRRTVVHDNGCDNHSPILGGRVRPPDICNAVRGIASSAAKGIAGGAAACLLIPAAFAADADSALNTVLDTLTTYVTIAGGVLCVWGAVVLGSGLNDHNGPGIQQGIWRIVGGGVIIAASALFSSLT